MQDTISHYVQLNYSFRTNTTTTKALGSCTHDYPPSKTLSTLPQAILYRSENSCSVPVHSDVAIHNASKLMRTFFIIPFSAHENGYILAYGHIKLKSYSAGLFEEKISVDITFTAVFKIYHSKLLCEL